MMNYLQILESEILKGFSISINQIHYVSLPNYPGPNQKIRYDNFIVLPNKRYNIDYYLGDVIKRKPSIASLIESFFDVISSDHEEYSRILELHRRENIKLMLDI